MLSARCGLDLQAVFIEQFLRILHNLAASQSFTYFLYANAGV